MAASLERRYRKAAQAVLFIGKESMKRMPVLIAVSALIVALFAGCETDDNALAGIASIGIAERGVQDTLFVQGAFQEGLKEIELGRIGIQRAQNLDLRLLAQRIFDDYFRANEQLIYIARENEIAVPSRVRSSDLERLRALTGLEFDQMFIRHLLKDQRADIKRYEVAARNARRPEVREFAATTLPVLQEHLRIAQNIGRLAGMENEIREAAGAEGNLGIEPYYGDGRQMPPPGEGYELNR